MLILMPTFPIIHWKIHGHIQNEAVYYAFLSFALVDSLLQGGLKTAVNLSVRPYANHLHTLYY